MRTSQVLSAGVLALAVAVAPVATGTALAKQPDKSGLDTSSQNGGDKGWGNCGRNSSGGVHDPLDDGGKNRGNGGFKKGDSCSSLPPGFTLPGGGLGSV